jgi:acetyl esterase
MGRSAGVVADLVPSEVPDRYAAIDSARTVSGEAPPTFIITGAADHLVRLDTVQAFEDRARKAGVETELVAVPYGDHGFDGLPPGSIGSQAYRQLTARWFSSHGLRP